MENWPIEGPRSALWVVRYPSDTRCGGPESCHTWWRMTCRLSLADMGVSEHMQMLRFLSLAATYDQLDLSNPAVIEVIARRVELIEYQHREGSREGLRASSLGTAASAALTGAAVLASEEADLFDGVGKIAGGACVAPAIVEFRDSELEKTAKLDKHSRKAREEKALLQNPTSCADDPHGEDREGAGNSGVRTSSWCGSQRRLNHASGVVVIHSPTRSKLPFCSVRWQVSCQYLSLTPCVFSLDRSVQTTLYRTLYAASTKRAAKWWHVATGECGTAACHQAAGSQWC